MAAPFIGLVITSCGFFVPAFLAWRRRNQVDGYKRILTTCTTVGLTSIAYHGTLTSLAHAVDYAVAHVVGVTWSIESVRLWMCQRRPVDGAVCLTTAASVATYWFKSRVNDDLASSRYWHMLFHVMSQSAWCIHSVSL